MSNQDNTQTTTACRNCGKAPIMTGTIGGMPSPEHPDGCYDAEEDGLCEACWDAAEDERTREVEPAPELADGEPA